MMILNGHLAVVNVALKFVLGFSGLIALSGAIWTASYVHILRKRLAQIWNFKPVEILRLLDTIPAMYHLWLWLEAVLAVALAMLLFKTTFTSSLFAEPSMAFLGCAGLFSLGFLIALHLIFFAKTTLWMRSLSGVKPILSENRMPLLLARLQDGLKGAAALRLQGIFLLICLLGFAAIASWPALHNLAVNHN